MESEIPGSPAKACGLSIDSRKSKQEDFFVYDASELRSKLFDFCFDCQHITLNLISQQLVNNIAKRGENSCGCISKFRNAQI